MFGAGMLNLGSIVLGLIAWGVPVWYLSGRTKGRSRSGWPYLVSLGCCGVSLWFQILYGSHLAEIEDVSAWLDTADAVAKVAGFLLITTFGLNLLIMRLDQKLEQEERIVKKTEPPL